MCYQVSVPLGAQGTEHYASVSIEAQFLKDYKTTS